MQKNSEFKIKPFTIVSSLFDDFEHKILSPLSCVNEFDSYWILECDLPLVDKKDVKVIFSGNTINIEAKLNTKYSEKKLGKITTFEYFNKSISLPGEIEPGKTIAKFQKGRLLIKIPKKITGQSIEIT